MFEIVSWVSLGLNIILWIRNFHWVTQGHIKLSGFRYKQRVISKQIKTSGCTYNQTVVSKLIGDWFKATMWSRALLKRQSMVRKWWRRQIPRKEFWWRHRKAGTVHCWTASLCRLTLQHSRGHIGWQSCGNIHKWAQIVNKMSPSEHK